MKHIKIILGILIVIIIAVILIIINFKQTSSTFSVENNDNGIIIVTAQKSGKNASGIGYITMKETQKLEVKANLKDKSSIKIEVFPKSEDTNQKILIEETFTSIETREFDLPSGDYTIRITTKKSATGSMEIKVK